MRVFLFAFFLAGTASAAEFRLDWHAPAGCATELEMRSAVSDRLHTPSAASEFPELRVEGTAAKEQGGWAASLVLFDGTGNKLGVRRVVVESSDCRALDGAASLVVAMMVNVARAELELRAAPPPPPPPPPIVPIARPAAVDRPVVVTHTRGLGLYVLGALSFGSLPQAGFGATVHVDVDIVWPLSIGIEVSPASASPVRTSTGATNFSTFEGAIALELHLVRTARFDFAPGIFGHAGALWASGSGYTTSHDAMRAIGGLGFGAIASLRLTGGLSVVFLSEVEATFGRDVFQVTENGVTQTVFQGAPAAGRIGLGLGWRFGS